jgi:folate-binding protein YgfZ
MAQLIDVIKNCGLDVEEGRVTDSAGVVASYQALSSGEGALLIPLLGMVPFRATGQDRLDFLHGQLSNQVKGLPDGGCNEALLLNHKGHALAQMTVCRRRDDVYLAVNEDSGDSVEKQLKDHIVFDQVSLENLSGTVTTLTLLGSCATELLERHFGEIPSEGSFAQHPFQAGVVLVHPSRRAVWNGFDLHVLTKDAGVLVEELVAAGARLAGEAVLEMLRVEAGIPKAEREAGTGILPQESGLERAVSYRKGCYLGQEIMARIEARGTVRRTLAGLTLSSWPGTDRHEISQAGKVVGRMGTVVRHPTLGVIALAVLRRDVDFGCDLWVGDITSRRVELPFR